MAERLAQGRELIAHFEPPDDQPSRIVPRAHAVGFPFLYEALHVESIQPEPYGVLRLQGVRTSEHFILSTRHKLRLQLLQLTSVEHCDRAGLALRPALDKLSLGDKALKGSGAYPEKIGRFLLSHISLDAQETRQVRLVAHPQVSQV